MTRISRSSDYEREARVECEARTTSKYCSVEKNILQVLSNDQYHGAHNSKPGVYYITLKLF